ncbi:sigma D regulator [Marinobacterium arenosum]|uniref:sigma D regulator n=1 Tax=Marinobacterium arenosum TaxID=2862496 RepID=UPI001C97563E|nr:sigma D regulator [Marinobacterium arenosum]MBY4675511.1 sigma D regulator [Marinobacterium arenosum]
MLEKCRNAKERWGGVSEIIDHWLEERQQLISLFVHLPNQRVANGLQSMTENFCQVLVDYLSSGHFEVYEQLLREGSEFNDGSVENAQELFPKIQTTTDVALDFNDRFSAFDDPTVQELREFSESLSSLGVALEERFELEDQLIEVLHNAHREQALASEG